MARPNILYIHSHDTGRYIQPFGRAIATPRLQRLAQEGVFFRQAFSAAPVCSASRSALLTGQAPHSCGMIGLAHRGFQLNDYRQHLAQYLGAADYHTVLVGVHHEAPVSAMLGYHEVRTPASGDARDTAQAAAEFLAEPHAQPFFLSVGFNETHRVFHTAGGQDAPGWVLPPAPLPDLPEIRADMLNFMASARALDDGVGTVLDALDAAGLAGSTLVIATTDHGIAFPGMKCTLSDHGLGVYLILRGPEPMRGGRVVDALVSHLDLYPTVCEVTGLPAPDWLQGLSLLGLLRGETDRLHDELFGEVTYHAAYEPLRSVRTQRWKYIRRFDGRTRPVLPNCDDSPSKTALLALGWGERTPAAEQLYDLVFDPNEAHNLAGDAQAGAMLVEMRARLERWMRATADPLLNGPLVPVPHAALLNDPDGLSPQEPPHRIGT